MLVLLVSNSDVWLQQAELLRIISTQLLRSLAGNVGGEVSPQLKHLVRQPMHERYIRCGAVE
ncbi:MAG: hypothetical protein V7K40_11145 [Nostoc sp.]|uniref:hypothetical protein n=1 Tax=Nostoc sp. TaxID=1180 RepID=UPI002FF60164